MSSAATKNETTTWLTIKTAAHGVWIMFVGLTTFCVLGLGGIWVFAWSMRALANFLFR